MRFEPTAEQRALQQAAREVCARVFPRERHVAAADAGVGAALWGELADLGVFTLRQPAASAGPGLGLGLVEAVLVFEELGRALVPGPLVATHLAAGSVPVPGAPVTLVDLAARPLLVEHLDAATHVVVLDDTGVSVVDAAACVARPVARPLDPLTPVHELVEVPSGERRGGPDDARRWRRDGALLTAALQVGVAAAVTEAAVDYARQREQFGRVIGSFQAVKHLCADMFVRAELARAAVHAAATTLDGRGVDDADRLVAGAKLLADEAATGNARACVQVHGGMGFTWELDVHLYLKRAWVHATQFGDVDEHADALAALL